MEEDPSAGVEFEIVMPPIEVEQKPAKFRVWIGIGFVVGLLPGLVAGYFLSWAACLILRLDGGVWPYAVLFGTLLTGFLGGCLGVVVGTLCAAVPYLVRQRATAKAVARRSRILSGDV